MTGNRKMLFASAVGVAIAGLLSTPAQAHCDGMDGPVVKAAQAALAKGDVNVVLIWVRKDDEAEIREAFERTLNVRKLSPQARELADEYFFETVVRVHRAAEGAPFTGLKPAGRDLGPAIPAADQALESKDVAPLTNLLGERMRTGLLERYDRAIEAKAFRVQDVDAGREYVETYVTFIHYVEGLYEAATRRVEGHYPEPAKLSHHEN
ncbi:MAG: hypothetical protein H6Q86_2931 [candidate division NC10 bacterium]|nr:hypothetical protein [candidate division NC10 bacterium]